MRWIRISKATWRWRRTWPKLGNVRRCAHLDQALACELWRRSCIGPQLRAVGVAAFRGCRLASAIEGKSDDTEYQDRSKGSADADADFGSGG
jgi:hypothetical protein